MSPEIRRRKVKILIIVVMVLSFCSGVLLSNAKADEGMHFHCSVCGSHDHGSLWHDSDKDGTPDR